MPAEEEVLEIDAKNLKLEADLAELKRVLHKDASLRPNSVDICLNVFVVFIRIIVPRCLNYRRPLQTRPFKKNY